MNVLVGGGSGFVGTALVSRLISKGFKPKLITRRSGLPNSITWDQLKSNKDLLDNVHAVINLAGANLSDFTKNWDKGYSKEVYDSRINTTKLLADLISQAANKPKVFITTSAVGYYTPSETAEYTENSKSNDDNDVFCRLCRDWESAAKLTDPSVRQVIIRFGLVLGRNGGLIKQIYWPFFFGFGGPTGSGSQWFPWIHIDDLTGIIMHSLSEQNVTGTLNAVGPKPCTNKEFSEALAHAMWRPAKLGTPEFVIKKMFDKDRARLILSGQKVVPLRTLESGYKFKFVDVQSACKDLVK